MSPNEVMGGRRQSGYSEVLLALVLVVVSLLSLAYPLATPVVAGGLATASFVIFKRHRSNVFLITGVICTVIGVAAVAIDLTLPSANTSISGVSPTVPH